MSIKQRTTSPNITINIKRSIEKHQSEHKMKTDIQTPSKRTLKRFSLEFSKIQSVQNTYFGLQYRNKTTEKYLQDKGNIQNYIKNKSKIKQISRDIDDLSVKHKKNKDSES